MLRGQWREAPEWQKKRVKREKKNSDSNRQISRDLLSWVSAVVFKLAGGKKTARKNPPEGEEQKGFERRAIIPPITEQNEDSDSLNYPSFLPLIERCFCFGLLSFHPLARLHPPPFGARILRSPVPSGPLSLTTWRSSSFPENRMGARDSLL